MRLQPTAQCWGEGSESNLKRTASETSLGGLRANEISSCSCKRNTTSFHWLISNTPYYILPIASFLTDLLFTRLCSILTLVAPSASLQQSQIFTLDSIATSPGDSPSFCRL